VAFGITYCVTDLTKWGTGKNSPLTPHEVDENFYGLDQALGNLVENPPQPITVVSVDYTNNYLNFHLTDTTVVSCFFPPVRLYWKGEWASGTQYYSTDIISATGFGVYLVNVDHVSAATFDPDLRDVNGYLVYVLMFSVAMQPVEKYDIALYHQSKLVANGATIFQYLATRAFTLPADLALSLCMLRVAVSDATITLNIYKNETTLIGNMTFSPLANLLLAGGQTGAFSFLSDVVFNRGDRLLVMAPDLSDSTAEGLSVNFSAVLA